jgi:hypothetical protein
MSIHGKVGWLFLINLWRFLPQFSSKEKSALLSVTQRREQTTLMLLAFSFSLACPLPFMPYQHFLAIYFSFLLFDKKRIKKHFAYARCTHTLKKNSSAQKEWIFVRFERVWKFLCALASFEVHSFFANFFFRFSVCKYWMLDTMISMHVSNVNPDETSCRHDSRVNCASMMSFFL